MKTFTLLRTLLILICLSPVAGAQNIFTIQGNDPLIPYDLVESPLKDGFYVTGEAHRGNHADIFLMKVNYNGTIAMLRYYGTSDNEGGRVITLTPDSALVIGGYSNTLETAWNYGDAHYMKVQLNGNIVWETTLSSLNNANKNDWASDIVVDPPTGNLYCWGVRQATNAPNRSDQHLAVLNPSGTLLWERNFRPAANQTDTPTKVLRSVARPGRTLCLGWYYPSVHIGTLYSLNSNGTTQWSTRFNSINSQAHAFPYDMVETPDGDIWTAGTHSTNFYAEQHPWIARIDSNGNVLSQRMFYLPTVTDYGDARSILLEGDFLLISGFETSNLNVPNGDVFLIKYDYVNDSIVWINTYGNSATAEFLLPFAHSSLIKTSRNTYAIAAGTDIGNPKPLMIETDLDGKALSCWNPGQATLVVVNNNGSSLNAANTTVTDARPTIGLTNAASSAISDFLCPIPLAVSDIRLDATTTSGWLDISWTTNHEPVSGDYQLEFLNGGTWELRDAVPVRQSASYFHRLPAPANMEYLRIRLVDGEGLEMVSNVVRVGAGEQGMVVAPTLVQAGTPVRISNDQPDDPFQVSVFSAAGQMIQAARQYTGPQVEIETGKLSPGVYFLRAGRQGSETVVKFMVSR